MAVRRDMRAEREGGIVSNGTAQWMRKCREKGVDTESGIYGIYVFVLLFS